MKSNYGFQQILNDMDQRPVMALRDFHTKSFSEYFFQIKTDVRAAFVNPESPFPNVKEYAKATITLTREQLLVLSLFSHSEESAKIDPYLILKITSNLDRLTKLLQIENIEPVMINDSMSRSIQQYFKSFNNCFNDKLDGKIISDIAEVQDNFLKFRDRQEGYSG